MAFLGTTRLLISEKAATYMLCTDVTNIKKIHLRALILRPTCLSISEKILIMLINSMDELTWN